MTTIVTIYVDKTFSIATKKPTASYYIKKAIKLEKGGSTPGRDPAGSISRSQLKQIAEEKMEDLNAHDIKEATKIICGSARSMGIEVKE